MFYVHLDSIESGTLRFFVLPLSFGLTLYPPFLPFVVFPYASLLGDSFCLSCFLSLFLSPVRYFLSIFCSGGSYLWHPLRLFVPSAVDAFFDWACLLLGLLATYFLTTTLKEESQIAIVDSKEDSSSIIPDSGQISNPNHLSFSVS